MKFDGMVDLVGELWPRD